MIEREMYGAIGRPAYSEAAQQIVGAGRQLLARITDIIELSRVEGSIAKPAEQATSIATVLREAHTWAVATFAAKRLTFGIRMPELDVGLRVQPLLMRQIVRELIKDAAIRTPTAAPSSWRSGSAGMAGWICRSATPDQIRRSVPAGRRGAPRITARS